MTTLLLVDDDPDLRAMCRRGQTHSVTLVRPFTRAFGVAETDLLLAAA